MGRIRLELPAELPFRTEVDVRVTDLNYGAHLGNDSLLSILHEARFRFLRHHGLSELDAGGAALIMADAAIAYRAEVFAGDRLCIEVGLGDLARVGCDVFYRVTRAGDGALVAEAKTGVVFLDPATRKPTALPEVVRRLA